MTKNLQVAVLAAAAAVAGAVAYVTYRTWGNPCVSREPGLHGEVMQRADGKTLYFNGQCWTTRPLPPTDTPF